MILSTNRSLTLSMVLRRSIGRVGSPMLSNLFIDSRESWNKTTFLSIGEHPLWSLMNSL